MKFTKFYSDIAESIFGWAPQHDDGISEKALTKGLGLTVPAALRDYYLVLGGLTELNTTYNILFEPEDLADYEKHVAFMTENQDVCFWGFKKSDAGKSDPIVYQGQTYDDVTEWFPMKLKISEFLRLMLYYQSVSGGLPASGSCMEPEPVARQVKTWNKVVDDDGLRIWQKDGMLISHLGADDFYIGAARDDEAFKELEAMGFESRGV